jgi:hypothetical protein
MRRLAFVLAAGGIALFGFAAPAQADPGATYGHCVSPGLWHRAGEPDPLIDPSNGSIGPTKWNPQQEKYTGAVNAFDASDGHANFNGAGIACAKP